MSIYDEFAYFYAQGPYLQFSERMAELLPAVLERFEAKPRTMLDIACGEGTFAVAMARRGFQVTGVDLSPQMLQLARARAERENVKVELLLQDMRSLPFEESFDLVTCWFDSLNYLLELWDLQNTFAGVYRALKKTGLFVFDMNTIYGLAVNWQRYPCYVQQDTPELFEIHRTSYDFANNLATMRITGFAREGNRWSRMDEEHRERGYTLEEIRQCLRKAGFQELACWGSLEEMSEPKPDSGRVWFVMKK
ncbi:MAG: class I SAM-dependent methyltransferase [Chloroflexi bacterium]|nr:class I SAM-dependent methyltransferase [Chloroflexota bacterium]